MRQIRLVDGRSIDASEMGFCSVHEHILPGNCPADKRKQAVEIAVKQLQHAYDLGMRTIIDVSANVDAALLLEVAKRSPMQIAVAPGFYIDHVGKYAGYTVEDYLARMMDCFAHGIDGSGVYPGGIKIASSGVVLTESEKRALTAAGMAQKLTGLPLCVHSVCACQHQFDLIQAAGAEMSRVYFCHMEANQGWEGRSFEEEVALLERILAGGSFLSFNNFNNWTHTPEACMVALIKRFARDGYADQLLATMDYVWSFQGDQIAVLWSDICSDGALRDYSYLITHVQPWMRRQDVPEDVIRKMNHENPVRLFG